jgi:hypothetical protein
MTKQVPPRLAKGLLRGFLRNSLEEEVKSDLKEKFHYTLKQNPISARIELKAVRKIN